MNSIKQLNFMIIDDSKVDLLINQKNVLKTGLANEAKVYTKPKEALLDIINCRFTPDIILLDIRMNEINGFEFIEHLKKVHEEILESTHIFLVSSTLDSNDIAKSLASPYVLDLIPKPLSSEKLIEFLKRYNIQSSQHKIEYYKSLTKSRAFNEVNLYNRIIDLLQQDDILLDPDLSLKSLARHLNTNEVYVSKSINKLSGKNFNQFLNSFRVAYSKKLMSDEQHKSLTVRQVALRSGFPSVNTFFRQFKDITGMTPNQFKIMHS